MTDRNKTLIYAAAVSGLTITLGFVAWWSFVAVAFIAGFYLSRSVKLARPVTLTMLATSLGWVITALVRDVLEGGRISAKLATLLHLRFAVAVYAALFVMIVIPSFFAAYSGSQTSKALR